MENYDDGAFLLQELQVYLGKPVKFHFEDVDNLNLNKTKTGKYTLGEILSEQTSLNLIKEISKGTLTRLGNNSKMAEIITFPYLEQPSRTFVLDLKGMKVLTQEGKFAANVLGIDGGIINIDFPLISRFVIESYDETNKVNYSLLQPVPLNPQEFKFSNSYIPAKKNNILRLMTYNVQEWHNYEFGSIPWDVKMKFYDKNKHWSQNEILGVISEINPDILALQETSTKSTNAHEMLRKMNFNQYFLCDADPGWFGRLQNGIFNKTKSVKASQCSISKKIPSGDPRCIQTITCEINNERVCFATLHLSYKNGNKENNIVEALDFLEEENEANTVLMGDFNTSYGSDIYNYIIKNYYDGYLLNIQQRNAPLEKFLGNTLPGGGRIDFIFIKKTWNFLKFPIMGSYIRYGLESDHYPVILDFATNP